MTVFPTVSKALLAAGALSLLSACAPLAPNVDSNFGNSLNALKSYQTINPQASADSSNPALDGRAGQEALSQYHKSFSAPAPQTNAFTIGIGGGNGSGAR